MRIELIGNYRIGHDPWQMIELRFADVMEPFDLGQIALPVAGLPKDRWQAPYDETIIGPSGIVMDPLRAPIGSFTACFFLYVTGDAVLLTPCGPMQLPPPTGRPDRLSFIAFFNPHGPDDLPA